MSEMKFPFPKLETSVGPVFVKKIFVDDKGTHYAETSGYPYQKIFVISEEQFTELLKNPAVDDTLIPSQYELASFNVDADDNQEAVKFFNSLLNPDNWKLPVAPVMIDDFYLARKIVVQMCLYLGGAESTRIGDKWKVSSKGYYHYIGA